MQHTTIAVDLAKSVFQVAVSHHTGRVDEEHRLTRARFLRFFAQRPAATVLLEACGSAHHWARTLFISGVNRSDDLFMFFKRPIAGLSPGGHYIVTVSVEIATDTPAGCFGVGGGTSASSANRATADLRASSTVGDDAGSLAMTVTPCRRWR